MQSIPLPTKKLALLQKVGPAFAVQSSFAELDDAHTELDQAGVPALCNGRKLSLVERVRIFRGSMCAECANSREE